MTVDPEIAAALAPMADAGFTPPPVGDIAGRRAMWEPIIGTASAAQPIPVGDSAGGGLAAALAILARERGGPEIARQILIMPMLDDRTREPDPEIAPNALWSYDDNATAWPALLGDAAGGPDVPATAAPARLEDATGLPPAYIEVDQIDAFRDEDLAYAVKLSRAGVLRSI